MPDSNLTNAEHEMGRSVLQSEAEMIGLNWRPHSNVATGNVSFADIPL